MLRFAVSYSTCAVESHRWRLGIRGNDLGAGHLLSLDDCMSLCLSHGDCRSIDYFRPRTNVSCHLNNITRLEAASDWMSSTSYDYYDFFKSIDGESHYVPYNMQRWVGSWYTHYDFRDQSRFEQPQFSTTHLVIDPLNILEPNCGICSHLT